jgi:hypothetical protein
MFRETKTIDLLIPLVLAITMVQPVLNANAQQAYKGRTPQRNFGLLTGTWQLDDSRSDSVDDVVDRAIHRLPANEQQRARDRLTRRLDAPDTIAIEQRGRRFTMASTRASQTTFDADGRTRTETTERGRTVSVNPA